ncbi:MAG: thioredoxin family protein, partial [Mariniblastus sp.]|nr:thioredoxin family protein [Mariniblastus sp.]
MKFPWLIFLALCLAPPATTVAQESGAPEKTEKIAWHGTWQGGLAEAKRTGKPILLVSAAPQCHNV